MGSFSIWHWLIVLAVVLLLFGGRGKVSRHGPPPGQRRQDLRRGRREGLTGHVRYR
jgi:sec-independent protein translocase protein TatA